MPNWTIRVAEFPVGDTGRKRATLFFTMLVHIFFAFLGALPATQAVAQAVYMEYGGLDFKDEFDDIVGKAGGCPSERYLQDLEDLKRREGVNIKPPQCSFTKNAMKNLFARIHKEAGDVEPYLIARGAKCQHVESTVHCVVLRDVTVSHHTGDRSKATKDRTIFTIDISFLKGHAPDTIKIKREDYP